MNPRAISRPAMKPASASVGIPDYRLGFGDVVDVKFFRNSEFNETLVVRPDGRVSLAKVGEIVVAGLTPLQLDSIITATYAEFVIDPEVTVIVREFGGNLVYVLGDVGKPGSYPLQRNMTVLQSIATAGGVKPSSQLGSVMLLRRNATGSVEAKKLNLSRLLGSKDGATTFHSDVLVEPYDIVYVPRTFIANASDFLKQVYDGLLPPLDIYLRTVIIEETLK